MQVFNERHISAHSPRYELDKYRTLRRWVMEYVLDDRSRVDCLTDEYAVEVEFAPKWKESIGQALFYGIKTGKKPGVVLIIEKETDERFLERLKIVGEKYDLKIWKVAP